MKTSKIETFLIDESQHSQSLLKSSDVTENRYELSILQPVLYQPSVSRIDYKHRLWTFALIYQFYDESKRSVFKISRLVVSHHWIHPNIFKWILQRIICETFYSRAAQLIPIKVKYVNAAQAFEWKTRSIQINILIVCATQLVCNMDMHRKWVKID